MEASALFSTSFRPPSLHLRSRFLSKSPHTHSLLLRSPPPSISIAAVKFRPFLTPLSNPLKPISASSSPSAAITQPEKTQLQGAKIIPLALSIAIGLLVRFVVPKPIEVTPQAWQLLSIFVSTIAGLVLSPLPVGAWALLGLTTTIVTKTLTFTTAFSAFTNEVIWLIVISFFFARGFVKTGLGDRIATYFVKWLGKSTLGLSYGLTLSEALIAPAMPSTTARAGGVFLPIIKSLSLSAGSKPNDPSSKKLGAYLIQTQFQCAGNSSALFLTAAAQNLLCLKLAEELGLVIASPWISWFKAASLPAFVSLLLTPYILYKLYPPETKDTPEAPAMAAKRLEAMGPVTTNEWVMIGTMLLAVTLWVLGDSIGIPSVVTAMLGLSVLLLLGVLEWDDCLSEKSAWDTLTCIGQPHKETAVSCCDEVDPLAMSIGSINTIVRRPSDGKLVGFNTDCDACITAIEDALLDRNGKNPNVSPIAGRLFVLVGAGGAGRALVFGAKSKGALVFILNRNFERGQSLARAVSGEALPIEQLNTYFPENGMILANCSAIGMEPDVHLTPVSKENLGSYDLVFDAVYTPRNTRLLQEAVEVGVTVVSGVEMFIRQALGQFKLFTNGLAPEDFMRKVVLEQF